MSSKYRPDIDGLRSVAVLCVLLFHLGFSWCSGGFVGVDVFFVISGFLITRLIKGEIDRTGTFDFKSFYLRRIRRLFPALFACLLATSALAVLLFSPAHLQRFGGSLTSALASLSNVFFWVEADYFDVSAQVKPLLHTWSLSIEEQFYLFWPITIYLLYRGKRERPAWLFLIAAGALSLHLNLVFADGLTLDIKRFSTTLAERISDGRSTIFFLLPFRVFEFVIGAVLAWLPDVRPKSALLHDFLFGSGLGLVCYAATAFNDSMIFPSYVALAPCLGTALLIYSGDKSRFSAMLTNRLATGIGLISYSLYLVHWPIIVFWTYVNNNLSPYDKAAISVLSLIAAYLSYRFIECPFRYGKIELRSIVWKTSSVMAVLMAATLGLHMNRSGGWPWRVSSPIVIEQVGDARHFHEAFYGGTGYPMDGPVNSHTGPDIVLLGDSHAAHYAEGLYREWAEPDGLSLYIESGLSFIHLPAFTRTTEGTNWGRLIPAEMDRAYSFIEQAPTPPLVIVSHWWPAQMERADLLDQNGEPQHIPVGVKEIIQGIRALKQRIGDSPLVVIGQVPTTGGNNLYDLFTRPRLGILPALKPEAYLTSRANKEYTNFNRQLDAAAKSSGDFVFLDPHDALCRDDLCRNTDQEGRLIYSDLNHLSKYGSREVIKAFLPQLKHLAQRRLVAASDIKPKEKTSSTN